MKKGQKPRVDIQNDSMTLMMSHPASLVCTLLWNTDGETHKIQSHEPQQKKSFNYGEFLSEQLKVLIRCSTFSSEVTNSEDRSHNKTLELNFIISFQVIQLRKSFKGLAWRGQFTFSPLLQLLEYSGGTMVFFFYILWDVYETWQQVCKRTKPGG